MSKSDKKNMTAKKGKSPTRVKFPEKYEKKD